MAEAVRPRKQKTKVSGSRGDKNREKKKQPIEARKERDNVELTKGDLEKPCEPTSSCSNEDQMQTEFKEIRLDEEADLSNITGETCDTPQTPLQKLDKDSAPIPTAGPVEKEDPKGLIFEQGVKDLQVCSEIGSPVTELERSTPENVNLPTTTHTCIEQGHHDAVSQKPELVSSHELGPRTSQHCYEANELFVHSEMKPLYPDLTAETILALKPLLHYERLYPEISSQPELVAFTKEQLRLIEPCSWLENVESCLEDFEHIAYQDRHDFHELLMNYWRCRKQLLLAETELHTVISDLETVSCRLWTFKEEHLTLQVANKLACDTDQRWVY